MTFIPGISGLVQMIRARISVTHEAAQITYMYMPEAAMHV
jgi:hypothetical protein